MLRNVKGSVIVNLGNGLFVFFSPRPEVVDWFKKGVNVSRKARRALRGTFHPEGTNPQHQVKSKNLQTDHCHSF